MNMKSEQINNDDDNYFLLLLYLASVAWSCPSCRSSPPS